MLHVSNDSTHHLCVLAKRKQRMAKSADSFRISNFGTGYPQSVYKHVFYTFWGFLLNAMKTDLKTNVFQDARPTPQNFKSREYNAWIESIFVWCRATSSEWNHPTYAFRATMYTIPNWAGQNFCFWFLELQQLSSLRSSLWRFLPNCCGDCNTFSWWSLICEKPKKFVLCQTFISVGKGTLFPPFRDNTYLSRTKIKIFSTTQKHFRKLKTLNVEAPSRLLEVMVTQKILQRRRQHA